MPTVHSTVIRRQMDHFILALADDPGATRPEVLLSLYWIGYTTELGAPTSGHVAYLWTAEGGGRTARTAVLTDAPALVAGRDLVLGRTRR